MKTVLKASHLGKTFYSPSEVTVLKDVNLDVKRGQALAIMGKSGEGKSTLLQILGTLEKPTSGEIFFMGKPLSHYSLPQLRNQHIGFIFQNYHLLDDYTVLENILMPAKIAGKNTGPNSVDYQRALQLLEKVGLSHRADFYTKLLSGGEKQRAAFARAHCNDPDLVFADEPSGNLDHVHSQQLHHLLISSIKEMGKALIVVTHDRELAALCDQIYLLKDGILTLTDSTMAS